MMKLQKSLFFIFILIICDNLVDACETEEATTAEKEDLAKRFVTEYLSKRNAFWNIATGNWNYNLKDLDDSERYNLCECVATKLQPNGTEVVKEVRVTTSTNSTINFSTDEIEMTNLPLLQCLFNKSAFYLVEGYRSNGLKNAYDFYVVRARKDKPNEFLINPEFIGVVRSVNFNTIGKLNEIVFKRE